MQATSFYHNPRLVGIPHPCSTEISALITFYSGEMHFYLMRTKEALEELQEAKTLLVKLLFGRCG